MEFDTQQIIRQQLGASERLLWSGRPKQGLMLRGSDGFMIPFSLLWCGFIIFWEYMAMRGNAPFFFRLWGLPFILIGLYLMFGRFFVDSWQRSKTYYGLTEQRAIIVSGRTARKVRSIQLSATPEIDYAEHKDGSGTIKFGSSDYNRVGWSWGTDWNGRRVQQPPMFERIERPKEVFEMIRRAQTPRVERSGLS